MKINEIFENMSYTGTALKKAERKKGIQPGTTEWFQHWFELPYMKEDVSQGQLNALEKIVDKVFARVGIDVEFTRHFLDRVNDERNGEPISIQELGRLFAKEYKQWGKPIAQMGPNQAIMKDLESDINVPFVLEINPRTKMLDLVAKSVMRKKDFRTSNKVFAVEDFGSLPSLVDLILLAVALKTTVAGVRVLFKTAQGYRKLLRAADSVGVKLANKLQREDTKDEMMDRILASQKNRFWDAAVEALHRLVTSQSGRQSLGGYAFDISKSFKDMDSKELISAYRQKYS